MDTHAPLKQRTVVDHPQHPWINESILTVKRKRRKAEKKWKASGSEISKKEYKLLCNQVKDMVKKAKDEFYAQKVHECEGYQKKLYKIIDSLMGRGKPNILPTASSNLLLAKNLNSFFISKIDTLREVLMSLEPTTAKMSIPDLDSILKTCTAPMDTMIPASVEEVTKIIKESSKATCMLDPMPTALVKEIVTHLALYITNIVNMALSTGIFPSKLKSVIVLPLLKKQNLDSESFKNYRPVSNLPFLSKVIEKVMACRLLEHMKENHLLDTLQSAYKKAHSTETALLRVQNDILTSIDQKRGTFLILLDLSADFDTVDHDLLLSFLENNIGLTGSVLSLFQTYLSGRSQCVSVNGVMSEFCHLAFGVPQGSVLGPLIFCTYLLPLGSILQHHKLDYHIYADDTQVYCSTDLLNPQDDLKRITACVSDIRTWMIQNKLKINDDKTEFLILHSSYKEFTANLNFEISQTLVNPSDTCGNLGVIFDSHMKMENQIQSICRSVNFHLRSINSVHDSLTDDATVLLVHALITSKLDYCNSLLHGLPDKLIHHLQRLQNIAARTVSRTSKFEHITPVMYELHWLPVKMRIRFKLLLLVYQCVQQTAPTYLCELLHEKKKSKYGIRSYELEHLHIPDSETKTYGDRAFCFSGPREWNKLSLEIRQSKSVEVFKTKLKTLLFKEYYKKKGVCG